MSDAREPARQAAIRHLWNTDDSGGQRLPFLYCLLDAARDRRIHRRLRQFAATEDIACLYQGNAAEELAAVAPYLVHLGSDTEVFDWIFRQGWGRSWGVFCWSRRTPDGMRSHFRRLTKVRLADGRTLLFRFYDPRALTQVLPALDPAQLRAFFGPVERYSIETKNSNEMRDLVQADGALRWTTHRLG